MPDTDMKSVDLALQGGGAHGAFTWGVLDRLLEEESIAIEGVSGTSAGAMNACSQATLRASAISITGAPSMKATTDAEMIIAKAIKAADRPRFGRSDHQMAMPTGRR